MKKKKLFVLTGILCASAVTAECVGCARKAASVFLSEEFENGRIFEYEDVIELPLATALDSGGKGISYDVKCGVYDKNGDKLDESVFPSFSLPVGDYTVKYAYAGASLEREFSVRDTIAPSIEFTTNSTGNLFLSGAGSSARRGSLPTYTVTDASNFDVESSLSFRGTDGSFIEEYPVDFRDETFDADREGEFTFTVKATDSSGNVTERSVVWYAKDGEWKPSSLSGVYLNDFSEAGYVNCVSDGEISATYDVNGNYYNSILDEYEGAKGVLKLDVGFNRDGYSALKIRLGKSFNLGNESNKGKYLVVRMLIEQADGVGNTIVLAGNNQSWHTWDGGKTRDYHALTNNTMYDEIVSGEWFNICIPVEYLIELQCASGIVYNEAAGFKGTGYEILGGTEKGDMEYFQFGFKKSYDIRSLPVYIDSICLSEALPEAEGFTAYAEDKAVSWDAVQGAEEYALYVDGVRVAKTSGTMFSLAKYGKFESFGVQALSAGDYADGEIAQVTPSGLNVEFAADGEWIRRNYISAVSLVSLSDEAAVLRMSESVGTGGLKTDGVEMYSNGLKITPGLSFGKTDASLLEISTAEWSAESSQGYKYPTVRIAAGSVFTVGDREYTLSGDILFVRVFGGWKFVRETEITNIRCYDWTGNNPNVHIGFESEQGILKGEEVKYEFTDNDPTDTFAYEGSFTLCGEELAAAKAAFGITHFTLCGQANDYHYFQFLVQNGDEYPFADFDDIYAASGYDTIVVRLAAGTRIYFKGGNDTIDCFLIKDTYTIRRLSGGGHSVVKG